MSLGPWTGGQTPVLPFATPAPPFAWTISAAGSLAPPAWSNGIGYTQGTVVLLNASTSYSGYVFGSMQQQTIALSYAYALCTTAGTSGSTAPTQLGTGVGDGSGSLKWMVVPFFSGGFSLQWQAGTPLVGPQGNPLFPVSTTGFDASKSADPAQWYMALGSAPDSTLVILATP